MSWNDDEDDEPSEYDNDSDPSEDTCCNCDAPLCEVCMLCHECNVDDLNNQWCQDDPRYAESIPEELRVSEGL